MMTKRSNHMPMFTKIEMTNMNGTFVRSFFDQKNCGESTLQEIIVQYAHAYGPIARLMNVKRSYGLPEYQAMKNSMPYAYPTMDPVKRMTLFMFSRWRTWTIFSRPQRDRARTINVMTIPKPEK